MHEMKGVTIEEYHAHWCDDFMFVILHVLLMQPVLLTVLLTAHDCISTKLKHEISLPGLPNRTGKELAVGLLSPIFLLTRASVSLWVFYHALYIHSHCDITCSHISDGVLLLFFCSSGTASEQTNEAGTIDLYGQFLDSSEFNLRVSYKYIRI